MGASQSAEAEADVDGGAVPSEPSAAAPEGVDPDKWSEEFAREYRRLRQAELGEDEDASEEPEQLDELSSISPARVPLKEMMVKASLSEIQSMLGPVIARGAGPEPDGFRKDLISHVRKSINQSISKRSARRVTGDAVAPGATASSAAGRKRRVEESDGNAAQVPACEHYV